MDSGLSTPSIFDNYYKLENPSACFSWTSSYSFKYKKSDIIFTGELQEVDPATSTIYPMRTYFVVPSAIIRSSVDFIIYDRVNLKTPLKLFYL